MDPLYSIGAKSGIHFACDSGVFARDFGPHRRTAASKW